MFTLLAIKANIKTMPAATEILESSTSLGEAISRLRELRGLTLRELANQVGVSAPFLSDVEHDRRNTDKLDALAKELGVKPDDLKKLDGRVPADLKKWMQANPAIMSALDDLRRSGHDVEQLISTLRAAAESPPVGRRRK